MGLSAQTVSWFQRDPGGTTTYVAPELQFRRSSRCATGGCAEVAITPRSVVVRSSEDPATTVTFTHREWPDLVAGCKQGEFDA